MIAARAQRAGPGVLEVAWELDEPADVAVCVGTSPHSGDHRFALDVPAGACSGRLAGLDDRQRYYVSLRIAGTGRAATVVAPRTLPFVAATNFRDIGGYPTASGSRTRWGHIFRSDGLHALTPADLEAYAHLGVRLVLDLRGATERQLQPDPVESLSYPLVDWYNDPTGLRILKATSGAEAEGILLDLYYYMLDHSAAQFGAVLGRLALPEHLPAVVHCTGGKDRTGLAVALLLGLLGVERTAILEDYELSSNWLGEAEDHAFVKALVAAGASHEAAVAFLRAPRGVMAKALDHLEEHYGGPEAYLSGPGALSPREVSALRQTLCEG